MTPPNVQPVGHHVAVTLHVAIIDHSIPLHAMQHADA